VNLLTGFISTELIQVYDPFNPLYQQVSSFFWSRYSLELDSWRDQPLWAYSLNKFNVTPMILNKTQQSLFKKVLRRRGFGGHAYESEAEVAMTQAISKNVNK